MLRFETEDVFIAVALTAGMVVGLTIYAFYAKTDFTMMGGLLFAGMMILIVLSILSIFFRSRFF